MLTIHNTIINSATTTDIALKRWKLSEVIMIQKEIKIQESIDLEF